MTWHIGSIAPDFTRYWSEIGPAVQNAKEPAEHFPKHVRAAKPYLRLTSQPNH
jgi:hypothetical protein